MSQSQPKQKFLPLREIVLASRPLVKRAVTFSCDGELAVAADDSVHVFVPELPDLAGRRIRKERGEVDEASSEDEDYGFEKNFHINLKSRAQYSEGSRHMPVSYPPLDPRVNKELFAAAGLPFPYDDGFDDRGDAKASDSSEDEDEDDALGEIDNRPFGAGYGPITGVGSSMNHVVHMAWSPSGLGVNLRPILAILTSAGVVAMYGDGGQAYAVLPHANTNMLQRRELNSWAVLWGVGERLLVPGQQAEETENIQGIAWAREIAPGQALLATINDVREVAILSVQTIPKYDIAEGKDHLDWLVHEVVRFKAEGPHPKLDFVDPDYTPCGTSFGLSWSPWVCNGASGSSLLSFIDRSYIGFRRITLKGSWVRGEKPSIDVDSFDCAGTCVHLSTDAFFQFEDMVWTQGDTPTCRGLLATPFRLMPIEVAVSPLASAPEASFSSPHTTGDCSTVYPDGMGNSPYNPIVDFVIHPPDPLRRKTPEPLFTAIRLSATTTNIWYKTNIPAVLDAAEPMPQWAEEIKQKLEIALPVERLRRGYPDDTDSESGLEEDDMDSDSEFPDDNPLPQGPEFHPHRFRLHGLAISPGGGVTAVVVSAHNTQQPERGGWHTVRSSVIFGHRRRRRQDEEPGLQRGDLTVEARLFEYLYGGGPPVPGINAPAKYGVHFAKWEERRERVHALFRNALEKQTCDLCGSRMTPPGDGKFLSSCEKGHFFGTCGTSGLAVQMPGVMRSCGTCGLRSIRSTVLMSKVPEREEEIRREIADNRCGGCGGKFLN